MTDEKRQIRVNQRTLDAIAKSHPEMADETYNTQLLQLNVKAQMADVLAGLLVLERTGKNSDSLERSHAAVNARNRAKLKGLYGSLGHDIEWAKP